MDPEEPRFASAPAAGEEARRLRRLGEGGIAPPEPESRIEVRPGAVGESAEAGGGETGSLRRLTAETAHDFNNLLSVILSCASELELTVDDPPARERAEEIRSAAERGARLTRRLIEATRPAQGRPAPVDLNAVVADSTRLLARALGGGVRLTTETEPDLPAVLASREQLDQVLLNLARNARDALGGHGAVAVRTALIPIPAGRRTLGPGWYVRLSVSDDGPGMDPDTHARALEPYFTTKERGLGTGLGLSTVAGIAREAGGDVRIGTVRGEGTTVSVYLPAVRENGDPLALNWRSDEPAG